MQRLLWKRRLGAFTLVELIAIIVLVAVVLGMLLLPSRPPRTRAPRIKCVNNLKNVGLAFRIFATDHQDRFPMQVSTNEGGSLEFVKDGNPLHHFVALSNEVSTPAIMVCPSDTHRKSATNFLSMRQANLSYFIGLDAGPGLTNTFLSGDRNLMANGRSVKPGLVTLTTNTAVGWTAEIHNLQGNVAMGDGSVQQFTASRLAEALRGTGFTTNRLTVP